jgi:hypothetical protein
MSGRGKSGQDGEQPAMAAQEPAKCETEPMSAQDAGGAASPSEAEQARRDSPPLPDTASSDASPAERDSTEARLQERPKGGYLDRALQARIGSILRDSFTDIEREPLPERLEELIKALQAGDKPR